MGGLFANDPLLQIECNVGIDPAVQRGVLFGSDSTLGAQLLVRSGRGMEGQGTRRGAVAVNSRF